MSLSVKQGDWIEDNLGEDDDEVIPFKYSITSYGADFPVDGLVKRISAGDIEIPSFQRSYVWKPKQASRFIESLLLGLPVPGIFLSKEQGTQKLLVIDGQQRLRTLQYFYAGKYQQSDKVFALKGVQSKFNSLTYEQLKDEDRRRLHDSIIHATIVKQDEPSDDDSSIYYIFERLNTGGTLLQPQEIRACIYHGKFNELLKRLNKDKAWRSIYGGISNRMRDQELVLRFFSLLYNSSKYKKPMKEFLNAYMGTNRHLEHRREVEFIKAFERPVQLLQRIVGKRVFKPSKALNAAVFDAVMVGLAKRLAKGKLKDETAVKRSYQELLNNEKFMRACETGTADEENVNRRLTLAARAFSSIR